MRFTEALQKIEIEKAKANIGDVRDWADGKYKKVSEGGWVKITETKTGAKEKPVAQSGIKKVIAVELDKHYKEYKEEIDKFEENWLEANQLSKGAFMNIKHKVMFQNAQSNSAEIKQAYEKYAKERADLQEDLAEVLNLHEIQAKKARETKAGKKEIGLEDDSFKKVRETVSSLFSEINNIKSHTTADIALGKPVVENYWLNTDTTFKNVYSYNTEDAEALGKKNGKDWADPVEEKWKAMKDSGKYEFTRSPKSSSEYLVDREANRVYRRADHWGRCASCNWDFDGTASYGIGYSDIEDFERNKGAGWANPEKVEKSKVNSKKVLTILKKVVKDDKSYLDEKASKSVKQMAERVVADLKNIAMLDDNMLTKIKKQYKELFAL